jgi:hypothetical protein
VVDKICKYFRVEPAYMFREVGDNALDDRILALSSTHRRIISRIISVELNNKSRAISDGLYYVYFMNSDTDRSVVCSLLAVRSENGLTVFRRVTRIPRKGGPNSPNLSGFHYGIITSINDRISLLGFDVLEDFGFSLLSGASVVSSNILYGGIALITSGVNSRSIPFAIVAVRSGCTIRTALMDTKVYPLNSPHLDLSVAQYLTQTETRHSHL